MPKTKTLPNKVRQFRERCNLSQADLASLVFSSQQQVNRIERGLLAVRLQDAARIAWALREPLENVFPEDMDAANIGRARKSHLK